MCEPVSIAMGVMAALSAVAGHQQSSAVAKQQTFMHEQNQKNAQSALQDHYIALQSKQQQEAAAAALQIQQRREEEMRTRSSVYTAAGEAGVTGFSVDALLGEISKVASDDVMNIKQNQEWGADQMTSELSGARNQSIGQMNSTAPGVGPSGWATALKIGAGVTGAYSNSVQTTGKDPIGNYFGKSTKAPTKTTTSTN